MTARSASSRENEIAELRKRLEEAEQTLRAIRQGEVDALVVEGENGPQVYTLKSAAEPYRMLVEQMREGALTLSKRGVILYCNEAFARMVGGDTARLTSSPVLAFFAEKDFERLAAPGGCRGYETSVRRKDGAEMPVWLSSVPFKPDDKELISVIVTDMTGEQLRRRQGADLDAMTRLQKVGALFLHENELEPVLGEIVDAAIAIAGADFGSIQLLDPASGDLQIVAQRGFPQWWLDFWRAVGTGQGSCGTSLERGERVIVTDVEQSPIFTGPLLDVQRRAGVRAVQSTPLISRAGNPLGMFSTHYKTPQQPSERALRLLDLLARQAADIIERKSAESALRESEERFRALATASNYALYQMSPDWTVLHALDGQGFLSDTVTPTRSWLDEYVLAEDQHFVMKAIGEAIRTKSSFDIKHRVRQADGTVGWARSRAVPLLNADGEVREWFGAAANITSQKEAEAERERLLGEVQTERDRISALVASMPDEVWFADTQGRFTLANPAARKEFKLDSGESVEIGKFAADLEVLRQDGTPRPVEETPSLLALKGEIITNSEEIIRTPATGELRYRQVSATPVRDNAGQFIGSVAVVRDITERKRAEEQLQLLMREVNHRAKNVLSLVLAIAHQTVASGHEDFLDRFSERIQALAASQDLLVKNQWKGVGLHDLVSSQLAHFADLLGARITLTGRPLKVSVRAAQAIGMAMHELATNAGKYGALSAESGCVEITWGIEQSPGEGAGFVMTWSERGGPAAKAPSRRGFGSYVIRNMIEASLDAAVSLDFGTRGLTWQARCPANSVVDSHEACLFNGNARLAPETAARPSM